MSDKFPEQSAFAKMFLGDMRWSNENLESSDIEVLSSLYKVVCADKNLKPSNLLNLDFYKFYSAEIVGAEKDLKPSDVLNSYGLYRKLETLSGEKLTPSNFLNFFNFYTKVVDSLNEVLEPSDILNLYNFYKGVLQKDANVKPDVVLNLYNFSKEVPKDKKFEQSEILNPDFDTFRKEAVQKGFKPDAILDLYRFFQGVSKDNKLELSEILNHDFYEFYKKVPENIRNSSSMILDLYSSYKEIVRSSNLRWEVILNKNFYDFHKAASQKFKPDVILDLYRFYKEIPTDKKFEQSEILNPDFDTFRKEAVQKGFKPDAILDLYRFYKILRKDAKIKPHDILDYYNFYKETVQAGNLKLGEVLNSRFYEFHEKVVVPADESSLKMENILSFYEFYRINCANQGQADVSPEQFDIWKSFYKFYAKVSLRTDKNPKDVLNPGFYELYKKAAEFESKGLYNEAVDVFKSKKIKNLWMEFHPHYNYKNKTDVKSKLLRIFVLMFLLTSILFCLFWKVDMSTNAKVASIFVFVLLSVAFIMNEALGVRIRNWWINYKLQPHFKSYIKHYVRIFERTPEFAESIYEIGNDDRLVPINDNMKLVLKNQKGLRRLHDIAQKWSRRHDTALEGQNVTHRYILKIKKKKRDFYLILEDAVSKKTVSLSLGQVYDLNDQIRLIYTNIKVYRAVSGRWLKMLVAEEILLVAGLFFYMRYFADPAYLYCLGFLGMMTGILFCSLIFNFIDGD